MILTVTENDPGRVQITLYEGHGADQKAVRHELTLFEIFKVHQVCTEALYDLAKGNKELMAELKKVAGQIREASKDHGKQPAGDDAGEEHSPMVGR
jgi:hypothetical protein